MSERLLVGTRKGLFVLQRNPGGWDVVRAALLGSPVTMAAIDRSGRWHAAVEHGHFGAKLQRSEDGGATWAEAATPKYPPRPEDADDLDPVRQSPLPWDLKRVWSLECGAPGRAGELWCGTIPGGLFHSSDGGDSWALVEGLWYHPERKRWFGGGADYPGIHSILVDPRDPEVLREGLPQRHAYDIVYRHGLDVDDSGERLAFGSTTGNLWLSEDQGAHWHPLSTFLPPINCVRFA